MKNIQFEGTYKELLAVKKNLKTEIVNIEKEIIKTQSVKKTDIIVKKLESLYDSKRELHFKTIDIDDAIDYRKIARRRLNGYALSSTNGLLLREMEKAKKEIKGVKGKKKILELFEQYNEKDTITYLRKFDVSTELLILANMFTMVKYTSLNLISFLSSLNTDYETKSLVGSFLFFLKYEFRKDFANVGIFITSKMVDEKWSRDNKKIVEFLSTGVLNIDTNESVYTSTLVTPDMNIENIKKGFSTFYL